MARLETISIPQLTSTIIKQLSNRKIFTVIDFIGETTKNLMKFTGLAYKEVLDVRKEIAENHGAILKNVEEMSKNENETISTGIQNLDILLNGGVHSGQIYEFCGASSSGKTSICLTISTNIALNSDFIVHYIDTKRDFSSSRIQMMLEENKVDREDIARVMDQIKCTQIQNIPQLFSLLYTLSSLKTEKLKLIIIDSLPPLFYVTPDNYESLYSLNHLSNICKYLINECRLSIIFVNSITQWRETEGLPINHPDISTIIKPMLGRFWRGIPNTRIYVEELYNEKRKLIIWESHEFVNSKSVEIKIVNSGVI